MEDKGSRSLRKLPRASVNQGFGRYAETRRAAQRRLRPVSHLGVVGAEAARLGRADVSNFDSGLVPDLELVHVSSPVRTHPHKSVVQRRGNLFRPGLRRNVTGSRTYSEEKLRGSVQS